MEICEYFFFSAFQPESEVFTTPFVKSLSSAGVAVELPLEDPGAPVQLLGALSAESSLPSAKVPLVKSSVDSLSSSLLFGSSLSQATANIEKTMQTAKINAVKIKSLFLFI